MIEELKALSILKRNIKVFEKYSLVSSEKLQEAIKQLEGLERDEAISNSNISVCPYVDETEEVIHSYLVISKCSPWDADESEMVEVKDNAESHKLLKLLEKHFGIPNRHKG